MLEAMIDCTHEALADNGAHGAPHEAEFERRSNDFEPLERSGQDDQRVFFASGLLRLEQPVAVALAVAKLERIVRFYARGQLAGRARIEKLEQPFARAHAHVVAALGTDVNVAFELGPVKHCVARRTLHPQAFGHRTRAPLGLDARRHDLFEPGHVSMINEGLITPETGPSGSLNSAG